MKTEKNLIEEKSYQFAVKIILLYKDLIKKHKEYVLSQQLLKAGTSIGANIQEGIFAESKADFVHKLHLSLKESRETRYWLNLLVDTDYIDEPKGNEMIIECNELIKILTSIINTTKSRYFKS